MGRDCNAYSFIKNQMDTRCMFLKECVDQAESPDPILHVNGAKKCQNCPKLSFTYGHPQTMVHYICDGFEDGNPYNKEVPTDTICHPTHKCQNPAIEIGDIIKCVKQEGKDGKWKYANDTEIVDLSAVDKQCNCPEFKVAAQVGTRLSCDNPPKQDDEFYILDSENSCALLCDGYYIMDLTCRLGDEGTAWWAQWDDGYEQQISGCIACFEGGCPSKTTTTPSSSTSKSPTTTTSSTASTSTTTTTSSSTSMSTTTSSSTPMS